MSGLILAVGWAYAQICRIYPDGGGVYTAAKNTSRTLAVVGALLVFADYTVTASLSVLDAFHYFGLPMHVHETVHDDRNEHFNGKVIVADEHYDTHPAVDAGDRMFVGRQEPPSAKERLWAIDSPGLWAIVAIGAIGLLNMLGTQAHGRAAGGTARDDIHHAAHRCRYVTADIVERNPCAQWQAGFFASGSIVGRVRLHRARALRCRSHRQSSPA